jgi:iron complex outermembrane receptor protein
MQKEIRHGALVGVSTLLALVAAAPAAAQEVVPQKANVGETVSDDAKGDESKLETIVVTGIRASQKQAIDVKRDAINSVDAIASEDLGKMPDQNVAESLQRVPGITIDRNRGVGNGVTVRGLGPQFNTVTVNGRVIATTGAGREFDFSILPSELISGAEIYKSPQANLNGASIGATIDINTLRPLEQDETGLRGGASARANIADLGDSTTPGGAGYFTWKSDSGRLGVAAVVSYDKKEERTDNFFVGASSSPRSFDDGYYGSVTDLGGSLCVGSVNEGVCTPRIADGVTLFRDVDMYHNFINQVELSERERSGGNLTLQYDVSENLRLTFDAMATYEDHYFRSSGISTDFSGGTLVDQIVEGGSETTETVAGQVRTVHVGGIAMSETFEGGTIDEIVEDHPQTSLSTLYGFNADWNNGPLSLAFDVSMSKAEYRNPDGIFTTMRLKNMDFTYDRRNGTPVTDFAVSADFSPAATDVEHRYAHYVGSASVNYDDTLYETKLDASWDDGGAVALYGGLGYSDRTKDTEGFSIPNACAYCGSDVLLPPELFRVTDFNFMADVGADTEREWVDYDTNALVDAMLLANTTADPALHNGDFELPEHNPAGSSSVQEEVFIGYLMAEFTGDLGSMPLAVNTGVRFEKTNFTSEGASQTVLSARPNMTGQNIIVLSDIVPVSLSGDYTDILPSLNARLNLTNTLVLRAGASRVISRPTLTDLSPAQSITSNPGNERISRGNPDLLPFRASQIEGGLEWYYDDLSLLSGTIFYKSIDSFITRGVSTELVDEVTFIIDEPVNGEGASVTGLELSYQTVFDNLPAPLDGFGTQISYTYTDSNADYTNPAIESAHYTLQGLSHNSYTIVGFYEKGPLQARVSYTWRDEYLVAPQTQTGVPEFADNYDQLDAGVQFNVTPNVILTAEAVNLTDSYEFHYANVIQNTQQYRTVGRRYSAGVRVRF